MNSVLGKTLYEIMNLVSTLFDHSSSTHDSPYIPEINPPEKTSTGPVILGLQLSQQCISLIFQTVSLSSYSLLKSVNSCINIDSVSNSNTYAYTSPRLCISLIFQIKYTIVFPPRYPTLRKAYAINPAPPRRERTLPTVHGGALLSDIHISKQLLNPSTHSKDIDHRKNSLRDTRPSSSTSLSSTTISTYPFPSTLHPFPAIKTSRIVFLYPIITFKAFSFPSVLRISINPVEDYRCYFSTTHPSMFKEPSCFLTFHFNILLCILCFSLICSVIYTFFYVVSIITSLYLSQITNNHRQIGHSLDAPVSTPSQRSDQPLLTHNTNQESSHSLSTPRPDLSTARRQDFNVYHEAEDPGPK